MKTPINIIFLLFIPAVLFSQNYTEQAEIQQYNTNPPANEDVISNEYIQQVQLNTDNQFPQLLASNQLINNQNENNSGLKFFNSPNNNASTVFRSAGASKKKHFKIELKLNKKFRSAKKFFHKKFSSKKSFKSKKKRYRRCYHF